MLFKLSSAICRLLSKNKINLKIDSNHKESTPRETKKQEEQIAGLIGSINDYGNPFHEAARSIAEMSGTERVEQFIKKRLLSRSKFL